MGENWLNINKHEGGGGGGGGLVLAAFFHLMFHLWISQSFCQQQVITVRLYLWILRPGTLTWYFNAYKLPETWKAGPEIIRQCTCSQHRPNTSPWGSHRKAQHPPQAPPGPSGGTVPGWPPHRNSGFQKEALWSNTTQETAHSLENCEKQVVRWKKCCSYTTITAACIITGAWNAVLLGFVWKTNHSFSHLHAFVAINTECLWLRDAIYNPSWAMSSCQFLQQEKMI